MSEVSAAIPLIHVIATIELHDGRRDEFLDEFHKVIPLVHAEEGCLEYGPTVDLQTGIDAQPESRADVVTVIEKWKSLEALEAHLMAPHMMQYRNRVKPMIRSVSLQILKPA